MSEIVIVNGPGSQGSIQYPSSYDQIVVNQGNVTVTGNAIVNGNLTVSGTSNLVTNLFSSVNVVTGSRARDVLYTNTTGKPMFLSITVSVPVSSGTSPSRQPAIQINGNTVCVCYDGDRAAGGGGTSQLSVFAVVPAGATYKLINASGVSAFTSLDYWVETY